MYIEAATAAKAFGHTEREAVSRDGASSLAPRLPKLTIMVAAASRIGLGREPEASLRLKAAF